MNMIFSHTDKIILNEGKVHSIMLQSTSNQYRIRKLLYDWVQSKSMTNPFLYFGRNNKDITAKQCYVIHITQSVFELSEDKEFLKLLAQHVKYEYEHNEQLIPIYNHLFTELEKLLLNTTLYVGDIQIEMDITEKVFEAILKQLTFQITMNDKPELDSLQLRKLYIDLLLKLNIHNKEVILIYEYPEVDVSTSECKKLIQYLESLNVTTLCITTNQEIVRFTHIENTFLIKDNGSIYDLMNLRQELSLFNYEHEGIETDELTILLAVSDFHQRYELLDSKYKKFIESNKNPM